MSLGYRKPPPSLVRELAEVAEAARALTDGVRAFDNVLPKTFPKAAVLDICETLAGLPEGTAEGCRVPLEYARLRLPAIRREHIEQEDPDAATADPDEPPPLLRGMGFDRQMRDLISSVTTALDEYRSLANQSWDDSVHAEPEIDAAGEPTVASAIEQSGMTLDALLRTRAEIQEVAQPGSVKADTLGRTVSDAAGLTRLVRAELRMPTVVLRWYRAVATSLADYPRSIRRAGDAIHIGIDIAQPLRQRWNDFWSDAEIFLFRHLRAFADTCHDIAEKLEQRRGSSFDELARKEAERQARRLILAGEPVPPVIARLVRRLDLSGSAGTINTLALLELFETLPYLRELKLIYVKFDDLSPLSGLTGLTSLTLQATRAADLSPLSGLTGLASLNLQANMAADLSPLSGLTGLTSLNLQANMAADLSPLSRLTGLNSLNLQAAKAADLSPLSGLTGLTSLNLQANMAADLTPLSGLTGLTLLNLQANSAADLSPLSGLRRLISLNLQANSAADLSPLSGLTGLISLYLLANSAPDLSPLSRLRGLTSLNLQANSAANLSPLSRLTGLTSLNLQANSAADLSPLSGLTELASLSLQANRASDVWPLSRILQLVELTLTSLGYFAPVIDIDSLDELDDLAPTRRVAIDLMPIGRLPRLERLVVRDVIVADWSPVAHVPHVDRRAADQTP